VYKPPLADKEPIPSSGVLIGENDQDILYFVFSPTV
jgi:hypothetical protein